MRKTLILTTLLLGGFLLGSCYDDDTIVPPGSGQPSDPEVPEEPAAPTALLWTEFVQSRNEGSESILPDFSYAGYRHGEQGVPDVNYRVFRVTDYGAIPDDGKSDRRALTEAITAATANGSGIILFPAGRFDLRPQDAPNEPITIDSDHIVLRGAGAGEGGTELFMEYPNQPLDGSLWNTPELISFRYTKSRDKRIADITGNARRGDFSIEVSTTAGLTAGQRVFIRLKNNAPELIAQELAPYEADAAWTDLTNEGVQVTEYHEIARISGRTVTFKEPMLHSVESRWGWTLHAHSAHSGTGVEDIAFVGNYKGPFIHHGSALHDSGFRMLTLWRQTHSWVSRCRFTNVSEALSVMQSGNVSVTECTITGTPGHSAIRSQASTGVFIGKVDDQAGQFHSVGVSKTAIGTVLWRNSWTPGTCFEAHGNQPRATLIDACRGGLVAAHSGGDEASAPNHLRDLVLWNFNETDAGEVNFNVWQRNTRWQMPVIVGIHGGCSIINAQMITATEGSGSPVSPGSLYEAQLARRLGAIPQWVNDLK